ncbi:hypothetical protein SESBI_46901 [Sesbania bispinosa]|nr:hypothetical protein SESBI_46901 [Sesbania bispinosa]
MRMRGRMTPKNVVEDDMRRGKDMRRKACVEEWTLQNMATHNARRKGWWLAMAAFGGTNIGDNEYPSVYFSQKKKSFSMYPVSTQVYPSSTGTGTAPFLEYPCFKGCLLVDNSSSDQSIKQKHT